MAPLILEGNTLGQKHRSYNNIVNDAIQNKLYQEVADINYEESDLDNLFKIDIACHNRNVEYILKVLKCEDMLYISRAVKRSTWLITDPQYAHIVNPTHLFNELFPHMISKAINKFILHIRLNLKDEKRVEEFFNYYKQEDLHTAIKWLPHCSITFIENFLEKNTMRIPDRLLTRLCERSITFLVIYLQNLRWEYDRAFILNTRFLIKSDGEKYLDIIESKLKVHTGKQYFSPKSTKTLMTMFYDRIMKNFKLYSSSLDMPTFAYYIKKEDLKDFLLKHIKGIEWELIHRFIKRLPFENRLELVKEKCSSLDFNSSIQILYSLYADATFSTAFDQLKKDIHKESNPKQRLNMLEVLLLTAKHNMNDIRTLLKYYRENHINEPFKFKVEFVNLLLSKKKTHTFDKVAWGYLNDLFISMDVYSESGNQDVQTCIKSIILYKVIQNEDVPEIIEKKFVFDTCKEYQKKITQEENKKVFSYLFEYMTSKIEQDITDQEKFTETGDVLERILHLLLDWKKELQDFPNILKKIKEIINLKRVKCWDYDITKLYNIKKSWKKLFFAESILLNPNQEAFINALKHGPEILETYKTEVEIICLSDNIHLDQFLKKIRIYWPITLVNYYKTLFLNNFNQITNHKPLIIGLCTLFSQNELLSLVHKYIPTQEKIDWTQHDEIELSLRKHIATRLHLARPQPSLAIALSYAKGDYIQYVLPSLNAILYNMSCSHASENIKKLLDTSVSLQKHGIQISSRKLNKKELIQLYSDIWKFNKNNTIRSILFCETFNILCKERDPDTIKIIWELLSMFIDNLNSKQKQNTYNKFSKVREVPECVRGEFWMKSIKFLKSLPANENCNKLIKELQHALPEVMGFMEEDVISEILLESLDERLSTGMYEDSDLVARFIWLSKIEDVQIRRYNKVLVPILERCFALWDTKHEDKYYVRSNLYMICESLCPKLIKNDFLKEEENISSIVLTETENKIQNNLPMPGNYVLVLKLRLAVCFHEIMITKKELINEIKQSTMDRCLKWQRLYEATASEIGRRCVTYLRQDVKCHFSSVYIVFGETLYDLYNSFYFDTTAVGLICKAILESKDLIEGHLLVLELLRKEKCHSNEEKIIVQELLDEIQKHPSEEVKTHLWDFWHDRPCEELY